MKTFISSKNKFTLAVLWGLILFLTAVLFIPKKETLTDLFVFYIVVIPVVVSLIWIVLETKYVIKENRVHYYSGPFRGKIEIDSIRKIEKYSGWIVPVTNKPALGNNGLIISYNKFDTIYLSPKLEKEFIEVVLKVNPSIEIG